MEEIPRVFQLGGGWGNVSGPGMFMIRTMTSGLLSSVVFGMTGASLAAIAYDTATIPFIISACGGFIIGVTGYYRDVLRKSLSAMDAYPRLLQVHLDANFSHRGFDSWSLNQLTSARFSRTWQMQSMLIAAWLTAKPTIDRIKEAKEEALIVAYSGVEVENEVDANK